jgi:hypothetical protein
MISFSPSLLLDSFVNRKQTPIKSINLNHSASCNDNDNNKTRLLLTKSLLLNLNENSSPQLSFGTSRSITSNYTATINHLPISTPSINDINNNAFNLSLVSSAGSLNNFSSLSGNTNYSPRNYLYVPCSPIQRIYPPSKVGLDNNNNKQQTPVLFGSGNNNNNNNNNSNISLGLSSYVGGSGNDSPPRISMQSSTPVVYSVPSSQSQSKTSSLLPTTSNSCSSLICFGMDHSISEFDQKNNKVVPSSLFPNEEAFVGNTMCSSPNNTDKRRISLGMGSNVINRDPSMVSLPSPFQLSSPMISDPSIPSTNIPYLNFVDGNDGVGNNSGKIYFNRSPYYSGRNIPSPLHFFTSPSPNNNQNSSPFTSFNIPSPRSGHNCFPSPFFQNLKEFGFTGLNSLTTHNILQSQTSPSIVRPDPKIFGFHRHNSMMEEGNIIGNDTLNSYFDKVGNQNGNSNGNNRINNEIELLGKISSPRNIFNVPVNSALHTPRPPSSSSSWDPSSHPEFVTPPVPPPKQKVNTSIQSAVQQISSDVPLQWGGSSPINDSIDYFYSKIPSVDTQFSVSQTQVTQHQFISSQTPQQ